MNRAMRKLFLYRGVIVGDIHLVTKKTNYRHMKNIYRLIVGALLLLAIGSAMNAEQPEMILNPTDDTYTAVVGNSTPRGSETTLRNRYSTSGDWRFDVYMKFDISSLPADLVEGATIRVYTETATAGNEISFAIYETNPDWDEASLVSGNRPANGALIDEMVYTGEAGWYEWDVSEQLLTLLEAEQTEISIISRALSGGGTDNIYFSSKESPNAEWHPVLVVQLAEAFDPTSLHASDIQVDGVSIDGFDEGVFDYVVELPWDAEELPQVWATPKVEGTDITVLQAQDIFGTDEERTAYVVLQQDEYEVVYSILFYVRPKTIVQEFSPLDDTYSQVVGNTVPKGDEDRLRVRYSSAGDWRFDTYLKFDLVDLHEQPVYNAYIKLYSETVITDDPVVMPIYKIATDWDESTLVSSNKPSVGEVISQISFTGDDSWYQWSVTSLVEDEILSGHSIIGMQIRALAGSTEYVDFNSKEHANTETHPVLVIETIDPGESTNLAAIDKDSEMTCFINDGQVHINLPFEFSAYRIVSLSGALIKTGAMSPDVRTINVNELQSGIYLLHLTGMDHNHSSKIVIP